MSMIYAIFLEKGDVITYRDINYEVTDIEDHPRINQVLVTTKSTVSKVGKHWLDAMVVVELVTDIRFNYRRVRI